MKTFAAVIILVGAGLVGIGLIGLIGRHEARLIDERNAAWLENAQLRAIADADHALKQAADFKAGFERGFYTGTAADQVGFDNDQIDLDSTEALAYRVWQSVEEQDAQRPAWTNTEPLQ